MHVAEKKSISLPATKIDMTENNYTDIVRIELTRFLEAKGCRKTPERYAILDMIYSMSSHFDVDSLYQTMSDSDYRVSKATIYNTIDLLIEAGLVRKHQFGNQPAQYERTLNTANHHHLICMRCGKVQEIKDSDFHEYLSTKKLKRFTPAYYALYVYGKCNQCTLLERRKARKKSEK